MPLQPGYGETPLSGDELDALLAHVVDTLGPPNAAARVIFVHRFQPDTQAGLHLVQ